MMKVINLHLACTSAGYIIDGIHGGAWGLLTSCALAAIVAHLP